MFCEKCGTQVNDGQAFCSNCGNRLAVAQPAYQQPAYQQPTYQQPIYQQPIYQQPANYGYAPVKTERPYKARIGFLIANCVIAFLITIILGAEDFFYSYSYYYDRYTYTSFFESFDFSAIIALLPLWSTPIMNIIGTATKKNNINFLTIIFSAVAFIILLAMIFGSGYSVDDNYGIAIVFLVNAMLILSIIRTSIK